MTAQSTADAATDLRTAGDHIEALLGQLEASLGHREWEQVQDVIALVTELYGDGLARIMELVADDAELRRRMAADDLVASLLVLHDLHPVRLEDRVTGAIDAVRPYLASHGGDVEVVGIDAEAGVVTLRMLGSCDGCASSSVTLELAVLRAIEGAAPEIERIEVDGETIGGATHDRQSFDGPGVAPGELVFTPVTLGQKPQRTEPLAPIYGLRALHPGRVGTLEIEGTDVIVCRVGAQLYAYRSACGACSSDLGSASVDGGVLRCGACGAAYDLPRAGRSLDGLDAHLDPLPLIEAGGEVRIAVGARVGRGTT